MNRREFSLQVAGVAGAAALTSLLPGLAFASPPRRWRARTSNG